MSGPLDATVAKLGSGQSVTIQVIGDSTAWGYGDSGAILGGSPWTPPTLRGWPGRFAIELGQRFNASVIVYTWNYPVNTGYLAPVTLYVGTSGNTITVYDGGWPGGTFFNILATMSAMLPVANPDVLIGYDGFNDLNSSAVTFADNYQTFVSQVQTTYCPGAPIIVTTQNGTPNWYAPSAYGIMVNRFLPGHSVGMTPPLQSSTTTTNLWVLDTQQAPLTSGDIYAGVHPNASGYAKIAAWMLSELTSSSGGSPAGAFITTKMGSPTGITSGSGGLILPANWKAGDEFTAQDEVNVTATLNALIANVAALGRPLPTVSADWHTGSVWSADDEDAVAAAINSLNSAVSQLGGPTLADVPPTGTSWTAVSENTVESAINALHAAVTVLSRGG